MPVNTQQLARQVKEFAAKLGFDACGIAEAGPVDPEDRLGQWLGRGFHADMQWMETTRELRQDVRKKLPDAQSVVVVARNYYYPRPEEKSDSAHASSARGRVARYAWGRDYHRVLKKPLRKLAAYLDALEPGAQSYAAVDSGPVMERSWAERAGLGWIGKNSLVLRRDLGSWFFLGVVISTVPLTPDTPASDHCGSCTACLDACPTDAIVSPQVVDANRCISYQTIENRGEVPLEIQAKTADWVFGCDICQEVCPWNRFEVRSTETDFQPRPGHAQPSLQELLKTDENEFNTRFAGTPIRRAKHAGIQRNAAIALKNAHAPKA